MSGLSRYLPNTRETAEETKRRVYREYGIAVIDIEKDQMPWEFREWLKWSSFRYGGRRHQRQQSKQT